MAATSADAPAVTVAPENGRIESWLVAAIAAIILALGLAFAATRPETPRVAGLTDWQLNAFDDLGPVDRSMHAARLAAAEEIQFVQNQYAQWLSIADLEAMFVPPFYQDAFWRANGQVQWELHHPVGEAETSQGTTFYFGHSGQAEGQGAYLIVQRHSHAGFNAVTQAEIWLHDNPNVERPAELRQDSLIRNGWRQVIPYSGADEARRIR